jgi:HAD superfamily hydrolase (TIGR01484 family)
MKYKIVIFDIGKTLLDKQVFTEISSQVLADIRALQKQGIKVGVCTMRTLRHCREIIPFELNFYICLNGSHITCDGKLIFDSPLEYKPDSPDYLSYGADYAFYSSAVAKEKALQNGFLIDKPGVAAPVYNSVLFDVAKEHLEDFSAYNTEYWEKTKALSLQSVDSSKSLGIQKVLEHYGFDEPILYFGDGPNDLPIFQTHKDCVCMGDCYPELCQYALFQTKPCKDDGVSFALRKIGLI